MDIERLFYLIDKFGLSLFLVGMIIFLAIKYLPQILYQYKRYVENASKLQKTMEVLNSQVEKLGDDVAILDSSVNELQNIMKNVGVAVNHNSDNLVELVKQVSYIRGAMSAERRKNEN